MREMNDDELSIGEEYTRARHSTWSHSHYVKYMKSLRYDIKWMEISSISTCSHVNYFDNSMYITSRFFDSN